MRSAATSSQAPPMPSSATAVFEAHRSFLTRLAYRMLGAVQDAEDVVQDAFVRYVEAGAPALSDPRAWFARTTTRLCLDRLRRARYEAAPYPGEWLPEPWVEPDSARSERDDTLSAALLVALHRLSAGERAVFLLHDVFGYAFDDVAAMLELEAANCRQLAARARRHLHEPPRRGRRVEVDEATAERRLGAAFFAALQHGDLGALEALLHEEVVLRSDGGGKATAVPYPLAGRTRLLRFFDRLLVRTGALATARVEARELHTGPALLLRGADGALQSLYQFGVRDDRIVDVLIQRNPDKLRRLA